MTFSEVQRTIVAPEFARFFGVTVQFCLPVDVSGGDVWTPLNFVKVGDRKRVPIVRDTHTEIMEVRYFKMITDDQVNNYCGRDEIPIKSRLRLEDGEEWTVIESEPHTEGNSAFTIVRTQRTVRHEIGNVSIRMGAEI